MIDTSVSGFKPSLRSAMRTATSGEAPKRLMPMRLPFSSCTERVSRPNNDLVGHRIHGRGQVNDIRAADIGVGPRTAGQLSELDIAGH